MSHVCRHGIIDHDVCGVPYGPWEPVPRWMFWKKKKWRRAVHGPWHYPDEFWEYADDLELAKIFIKETFGDT